MLNEQLVAAARIEARNWTYRYPGRASPALADVSLDLGAGELVVLMGASGSGKSTLLGALAGTLPEGERTGSLQVQTGDPGSAPGAGPGGVPIGLVQQEPEGNVVMELVGDDVAFPLESAAVPVGEIWPRVVDALEAVGLEVPLDRSTAQLSGGQAQLLAVAAAAVARPALLLLDEPTANLDPTAAADVLSAVLAVRAATGCTVVVVEHRVEPWLARADRVLLVHGGAVTAMAPDVLTAELDARPDVARRVWLDHAHLPKRPPTTPRGVRVLDAHEVAVSGRLAPMGLAAHAGEVVALTGPPGSGKSTLLACLAGLLEPTHGSVDVRAPAPGRSGTDPWQWPARDVAATFGVVFQNPEHQFVTNRVIDELAHGLVGASVPGAEAAQRADRMLARLHLAPMAQADPFTLSGGEQRRLSVGTALVLDPGILLLDEPTFGQDPTTWAEMVDVIADHRDAGGTVVLATHDPDLVTALGAREVRLVPLGAALTSLPGASALPTAANLPLPPHPSAPPTAAALPLPEPPPQPDAIHVSDQVRRVPQPDAIHVSDASAASNVDGIANPRLELGSDRGRGGKGSRGIGGAAIGRAPRVALPTPGRATRFGRLDPLALLGTALLLSVAALASMSATLNVGLALLAAGAALAGGLPPRRVGMLAIPALVATLSVGFSNALLSPAGPTSAEAWQAAALPASRVLAVALPGLVAAVALDPTALADALVARLRVPARAAYSVLAALRLLPLLADEWGTLARASRARGLGGSGPRAKARQFVSITFRLLVAALRRGGRLAIALDARGLRPGAPRTIARPLRWGAPDVLMLLGGLAALAVALTARA